MEAYRMLRTPPSIAQVVTAGLPTTGRIIFPTQAVTSVHTATIFFCATTHATQAFLLKAYGLLLPPTTRLVWRA